MLELHARILRSKAPLYRRSLLVALALPCPNLAPEHLLVRYAPPSQALLVHHAQLDLHLVEPGGVLGRVMELQLAQDAPGLLWLECFVERSRVWVLRLSKTTLIFSASG